MDDNQATNPKGCLLSIDLENLLHFVFFRACIDIDVIVFFLLISSKISKAKMII